MERRGKMERAVASRDRAERRLAKRLARREPDALRELYELHGRATFGFLCARSASAPRPRTSSSRSSSRPGSAASATTPNAAGCSPGCCRSRARRAIDQLRRRVPEPRDPASTVALADRADESRGRRAARALADGGRARPAARRGSRTAAPALLLRPEPDGDRGGDRPAARYGQVAHGRADCDACARRWRSRRERRRPPTCSASWSPTETARLRARDGDRRGPARRGRARCGRSSRGWSGCRPRRGRAAAAAAPLRTRRAGAVAASPRRRARRRAARPPALARPAPGSSPRCARSSCSPRASGSACCSTASPRRRTRLVLRPVGELDPAASGASSLVGDRVNVRVSGLQPTGDGQFYELWLLGADKQLVGLGSFRVGERRHGHAASCRCRSTRSGSATSTSRSSPATATPATPASPCCAALPSRRRRGTRRARPPPTTRSGASKPAAAASADQKPGCSASQRSASARPSSQQALDEHLVEEA